MAVYFANKGHIELDVIRTMGVSVKETTNPIGFFGTGLKYAIATLLRTGHIISLRTNGETIQFRTKPKEIRGQVFNMIFMDDEQLGFTTDLGKNWQVWQAYRELYSNCLDERGSITSSFVENDTIFMVEGPEIDSVHHERGKIFLTGEPWLMADGVEIHRGKSQFLYYRGVRVQQLPKPTRFTYNITVPMMLTEDRTLASMWDANYKLATRLPRVANPEYCNKVLDPEQDIYEDQLDFSDCADPSEEYLEALEKFFTNAKLSESRRNMLKSLKPVEEETFTPNENEMADIVRACDLIRVLNVYVRPMEITFVENLGVGVYACVRDNKMFLSRQCVANGTDFIAITIYEEWLHHNLGYKDESRGLQQFLFDKILELIKREVK